MFVVQNITFFPSNLDYYTIITRQNKKPVNKKQANLRIYQKGAYYAGLKIFNKLPIEIKNTSNTLSNFKSVLKQFLNTPPFYTIEEYLR
jgi:hypothetical protein